jgi:arginyl-tRNA synthetase
VTPAALADLVRSVAHDVLAGRGLDTAVLPGTVTVQRPRSPEHGDYATSVALQTARKVEVAPREFAGWLAEALRGSDGVRSVEVAGPGFLNLWLAAGAQGEIVRQVLAEGARYGTGDALVASPTSETDVELWSRRTDDNPVCHVQYAHSRLAALGRGAAELGLSAEGADLALLTHEREGELIRTLGEFGRIVAGAAELREPHRVARYLEQLTAAYHRFDDTCRVLPIGDEEPGPLHTARLVLCAAARQVLANGLHLLGVRAPERM